MTRNEQQTTTAAQSRAFTASACSGQVNGFTGTGKSAPATHMVLHAVAGGYRVRVVGDSELASAAERIWARRGRHRDLGLPPLTLYLDEAQNALVSHLSERGR